MKTDNGQIAVVNGEITVRGVSAPIEMWEPLGVRRANWMGVEAEDQPAEMHGEPQSSHDMWQRLEALIAMAKDQLLEGVTAERVLNRAMSIDAQQRAAAELCSAMTKLGSINVSVPSNINVWQHLKGESQLRAAAQSVAEAAKALTDKISE